MSFDMGPTGIGWLIVISLLFGVITQVVLGAGTRWMWLIGAGAWLIGGLFFSEVVFGTFTEDEIQPIIDGLALDESLLGGLLVGVPTVLLTWYVTRQRRIHPPIAH
ncbi:MAG TPA: hypothetical protein VIH00_02355 [Candidatus Limnocylindrales bacterium]